jgi:hypothetical protein
VLAADGCVNVSDCMVYTTGSSDQKVHSHWTALDRARRNISLAVKLWRPEEWHRVKLHLALSVLPIPSSASQVQEWQAGVEVMLSNTQSGIVAGTQVITSPPSDTACPPSMAVVTVTVMSDGGLR